MTVRTAELLMAILMGVFSIYLMVKSTELPIGWVDVAAVAGSLIITVALFSFIGAYGALPLFLLFYIRFLGKHSWRLTAALTVGIPVVTFYFFEITLKIILPKGITEPLFIPLYKIFL
jgi:hypothetical protein